MKMVIGKPFMFKDGRTFPLVPAVVSSGLVFASGQVGWDKDQTIVGSTIEEQTRAALTNVQDVLHAAGASMADAVKVTVYLTRTEDFAGFNAEYARWFEAEPPARSTICTALMAPGLLVEIDVIAAVPDRAASAPDGRSHA